MSMDDHPSKPGLKTARWLPPLLDHLHQYQISYAIQEPLINHNTWRIGGPADLLAEPQSIVQVAELIKYLTKTQIPWIVIGKGSNLLFHDNGLRGVAIKLDYGLSRVSLTPPHVSVEAGISIPRFALRMAQAGLSGLEHTIGIPGNLGGLVTMNGGSLRQSIGDVIDSVMYVDGQGNIQTRTQADCDFRYRHSWFQSNAGLVVQAKMTLSPRSTDEMRHEMRDILRERRAKFPLKYPNCGSVFKNTPQLYKTIGPPGLAIETMQFKGMRVGDAEVSPQHANFIINHGRATCEDVLELIACIGKRAQTELGCPMETEVRYVTPDGIIQPAFSA